MKAVGRDYSIQTMKSIWALFVIYITMIAITALLLGIFGNNFHLSLMASVAMLSNIGPAVMAGLGDEGILFFTSSTYSVKIVLLSAMILGRVEILVLLSLMNITYWRS